MRTAATNYRACHTQTTYPVSVYVTGLAFVGPSCLGKVVRVGCERTTSISEKFGRSFVNAKALFLNSFVKLVFVFSFALY